MNGDSEVFRSRSFRLIDGMIKILRHGIWPAMLIAFVPAVFSARADVRPRSAVEAPRSVPLEVVQAYLRATHAREFGTAYGYISSSDRRVRNKNDYLRGEQSLHGFALELARWFAAEMKVWIIEERSGSNRARFEIGYRLPNGDEVADRLHDWSPDKLNALSAQEQRAILTALEKLKEGGKMVTVEGRETFDLHLEKDGWKIFEDWKSRQRVLFQAAQPRPANLAVKFLRNDLLVKGEEPFQVDFQVTNRTERDVWVKVKHSFAPRQIEKNIGMIVCGSLVPFRLDPRETREFSSAYILRGSIPKTQQISIIYEFSPTPASTTGQISAAAQ
jgi:hypothetical protein